MTYSAMGFETFGNPNVFRKMELQLPSPGESQVVVRTEASSVNFADIMARQGRYHISGPPYVPGLDFVGTVISAGSDLGTDWIGQRVIGFGDTGSYATEILADVDLIFAIPATMQLETAAACPLLIGTTYALLHQNRGLQAHDNVLIHAAAGGIGLTAIQLSKEMGAASIIGLVGSKSKAEVALKYGATHAIIVTETPEYGKVVSDLLPGGVDLILNSVAGSTLDQDLKVLRPGGQIIVFGMSSGEPGIIRSDQLHHSSRTVTGFSFGRLRSTDKKTANTVMKSALELVTSGKITFPEITTYNLFDVADAHRAIESRNTVGKIILIP